MDSSSRRDLSARVFLEQVGKLFFERLDLGPVADQDVRIVRVVESVVLMVGLGVVETLQRHHLRHNGIGKHFGRIELRNVGGADLPLFFAGIEDCRAIRRSNVRSLTIELRRVVNDGKENLQKLAVRDL